MASCHAAADRRDIRECAGRCIKTLHFYGCDTAASDYTCFLHGDQLVNSRTCATCNRHALCCFNPKRRTSGHRAAHQCAKFLRGPPVDRVCQRGAGDTPTVPQPLTSSLAGRWAPLATAFLKDPSSSLPDRCNRDHPIDVHEPGVRRARAVGRRDMARRPCHVSGTFDVSATARYQRPLTGRWPVPNTASEQKLTRHLGEIPRRAAFEHTRSARTRYMRGPAR